MVQERITILSGDVAQFNMMEGRYVDLGHVVTIGRAPDNDLVLEDAHVSRHHAEIVWTARGRVLRDLASAGGTWVDNRRILEYPLVDGAVFRIGSATFRYEGEASFSPIPAPAIVDAELLDPQIQSIVKADDFSLAEDIPGIPVDFDSCGVDDSSVEEVVGHVLREVYTVVPARHAAVLLCRSDTGTFEGFLAANKPELGDQPMRVSMAVVQRVYDSGDAVFVCETDDSRFEADHAIICAALKAVLCVPIVDEGEKLGVIYASTTDRLPPFGQGDLERLVALSKLRSMVIGKAYRSAKPGEGVPITMGWRDGSSSTPATPEIRAQGKTGTSTPDVAREKTPVKRAGVLGTIAVLLYLGRVVFTLANEAQESKPPPVVQSQVQPSQLVRAMSKTQRNAVYGAMEQEFREAIALDPNDGIAYYNLGAALDAQGRTGEAIEAYRNAATLSSPIREHAYVKLGDALQAWELFEESEEAYREAIRIDPEQSEYYCRLAHALYRQRQNDAAEEACRKAIELDPFDGSIRFYLGTILSTEGKFVEAEQAYRLAIELDPNQEEAKRHLELLRN